MAAEAEDRALQLNGFFLPSGDIASTPADTSTDWLQEPEIPSPEEILSQSPPPLLKLENEDINSKQKYLEKQYRMQRFEAVEPTRLAVENFRQTPLMPEGDSAHIYTNVQVQGVVLTARGAAVRVSFSTDRAPDAPVDWANSNRLRQGSLVALSTMEDGFNSKCRVATVGYRFLRGGLWPDLEADPPEPDDTPPRVDLYFSAWSDDLMDPETKYYMLEAKEGYFESFRHTMTALQTATLEKSVIDKYVLANDAGDILSEKASVKLRPQTRNTLDKSQASASVAIMSQEFSITQGPPGTGKTHTTVMTIEEMIRQFNPTKPIIVAAQTNHAVDQLLERCVQKDLAICRLGSRTTSESIEEHSLFRTRERNKGVVAGIGLAPGAYRDFETARQVLELCLKKASQGQQNYDAKSFRDAKIITQKQLDSLQDDDWEASAEMNPLLGWLGWSTFKVSPESKAILAEKWKRQTKGKNQEEDVDGDHERRLPDPDKPSGPFVRFHKRAEPPAARFKSLLARHRDLYNVKTQHREELFNYMCYELSRQSQSNLEEVFEKFQAACQRLQRMKTDRDNRVIAKTQVQILGCTITGLSKYRELICRINPDILIIDEASEATEGSIAAALLPSLKHLALVGDHQQLTPSPIHRVLSQPIFAFDVSLFERLVTKNGMPCQVLNMQRRMIPEIRQLINIFYPNLRDHSTVLKREAVKGLGRALWWFDHAWPEQTGSGASGKSICNNEEADMIVNFAQYLLRCGTPVEKLTILTFYSAQRELIEMKLGGQLNICKTVDSFQGCENDVILLSIVRSPRPGQVPRVGFVENIHRATVALSRARNAMYIFGNATNLKGSTTWGPVLDALSSSRDNLLPLVCPIHNTTAVVRCPQDWTSISGELGCRGQDCEAQPPFIADTATMKLSKAALDQVEGASHRVTPSTSTNHTASTGASKVSSARSSDHMIEIGYEEFIEEFEEMMVKARADEHPADLDLIELE